MMTESSNGNNNVNRSPTTVTAKEQDVAAPQDEPLSPTLGTLLFSLKVAAKSAVQIAQELDEKHHITEKTKAATHTALQKAKELDEKYEISKKTKAATETAVQKALEFDEEHGVVESVKRGVEAVSDSANTALERAADYDDEHRVVEKSLAAVTKSVEYMSDAVKSVIDPNEGAVTESEQVRPRSGSPGPGFQ